MGRLVGHGRPEGFSRAFQRWSGLRPQVYREFGGGLSPAVARDAAGDHPALAPRWLAGATAVAPGTACGCCGGGLVAEKRLRVFDALAPICDGCARREAPELGALLRA